MKTRPRTKRLRIGRGWKPSGERPKFTFTVTGDLPDLAHLLGNAVTQAKLLGSVETAVWDRPRKRASRRGAA